MRPWLDDGDVQLYHGDAWAVLNSLPEGCAQTCVKSLQFCNPTCEHRSRPRLPRECVACGRPCPPHLRWCSNTCFYQEDGYPDDRLAEDTSDEEDR